MSGKVVAADLALTDMGIYLGAGELGVPQEVLDYPEIGASVEQVGGEGMAYYVGEDSHLKPCLPGAFLDYMLDAAYGYPFTEAVQKDCLGKCFTLELDTAMLEIKP